MKINIKDAYLKGGLWALLLAVLGFTAACNETIKGGGVDMYGTPSVTYQIKAKVVDTKGIPVPNISIKLQLEDKQDTKQTDQTGVAEFKFISYEFANKVHSIQGVFTDMDAQNRGWAYRDLDTVFRFNDNSFVKPPQQDGWVTSLEAEITAVMRKK